MIGIKAAFLSEKLEYLEYYGIYQLEEIDNVRVWTYIPNSMFYAYEAAIASYHPNFLIRRRFAAPTLVFWISDFDCPVSEEYYTECLRKLTGEMSERVLVDLQSRNQSV